MFWHVVFWKWWFQIPFNCEKQKMHVHHVQHSSRARVTVLSLPTSLWLARNMNVTVAKELYYIFSEMWNFNTSNFSLTLSIHVYRQINDVYIHVGCMHPYLQNWMLKETNKWPLGCWESSLNKALNYINADRLHKLNFMFLELLNSLYSDGFSHTYWYNKFGTAHVVFLGVTGRIF